MSCGQHPALNLAGRYKCLIFTLLNINFSRNIFAGEVDQVVLRVQGVMIWWWAESCRNFTEVVSLYFYFSFFFLVCFFLCAAFLQLLGWVELKKISHQCIFSFTFFGHVHPKPAQDGFLVLCLFAVRLGFLILLFSPLVYPLLLCIRFLSSNTSLGRFVLLAQLVFYRKLKKEEIIPCSECIL